MRVELSLPLSKAETARATGAYCQQTDDFTIRAICTDSREVKPGDLFVALAGERFDGENYAETAKQAGARVLSARHTHADFRVPDTKTALLSLAQYYKTRLVHLRYTVAITGSVGKTTTKEILARMLDGCGRVHATPGNFNNEIGVPLTILSAPADTEFLICEIGMNHKGEIERLSRALCPDIALITNIGTAHLGNLGSREMIAEAKLEIRAGLRGDLLLPKSEPLLTGAAPHARTFSLWDPEADFFLLSIEQSATKCVVDYYSDAHTISAATVHLMGEAALQCLCAAMAICDCMNLTTLQIKEGLSLISEDLMRQKLIRVGNIVLLEDAYNASPESVMAAFGTMNLYRGIRKGALLGDMLELGGETEAMHRMIGRCAFEYGLEHLYLFGVYAPFIAEGAKEAGFAPDMLFLNTDTTAPEKTVRQIRDNHFPGEMILAKGSHRSGIQEVLSLLTAPEEGVSSPEKVSKGR